MSKLYYPNSLRKKQPTSNPSHVQKFGQGKELTILYVIEHTMHDVEVEEINFSNIHSEVCYSLEEMFSRLNYFQSQGYNNISVNTQVTQVENVEGCSHNVLIEDIANDIDITINTTQLKDTQKENKQLNRKNESLQEELSMYESFLNRYNSTHLFEKYLTEYDTNKHGNKDNNNLYWYEFRLRGFSLGCQPKGHKEVIHDKGRWGIISYDRQLEENELFEYDLQPYRVS
jgi:hypothetical protein